MRAGAVPGVPGPSDALPGGDRLTVPDGDRGQVGVLAVAAVGVPDDHLVAEGPLPAGADHPAVRDGLHRRTRGHGEVDAGVVALRPGGPRLVVRRAQRRADRRDEPAAGRGTVGAGRGGPLLRGRWLRRRPGLLPLLLLLLLLPLLLGLLALLGRLGGGRLRALPWRRGPVGLPGPAVRQREPLAGQDQVRVGADGRAVGVVQLLPAAAHPLAGRDAGEGVAADDGVHLGAARAGLRGLLRLDVLDRGPAALACRPGLLCLPCLLLLAGSGVPGVLTVGPV